MNLQKPTLALVKDPAQLTQLLVGLYEQAVAQSRPQLPGSVPALKAVTMPSFAEMRKRRGDDLGELGPRACIVTGKAELLDGDEGVFVWDPTSRADDDESTIIRVFDVEVGRWRKMSLGGGGGSQVTGTAVLDFGATPQTDATVAVAAPGVTATSKVQVWFQGDTTATNNEDDHVLAAQVMGVGSRTPVAGVGFTIDASATQWLVTGTLVARWAYQ